MNVKAKLARYEKLEFSITLTAPVDHWRTGLEQLKTMPEAWPMDGFIECIESMLGALDKTYAHIVVKEGNEKL